MAEAYFFEYGLPMIEEEFGEYAGRIAAGDAGPLEGAAVSFETYLRSELETYSDKTLRNLYEDMVEAAAKGINMPEKSYEYLARSLGYESLESLERTLRRVS